MSLTFAVLGTLALMLPALAAIFFWNIQAKRNVSASAELTINTLSVLTIATAITIAVNIITWLFFTFLQGVAEALKPILPCTAYPSVCAPLPNLIEALILLIQNGGSAPELKLLHVIGIGVMILCQTFFSVGVVTNDGVALWLEDLDISNAGWAHTFVWLPSRTGYHTIATVLTSIQHNGLGVGYRGLINDLRSNRQGETLNICLSNPRRFLYDIRATKTYPSDVHGNRTDFIIYEGEKDPAAVSLSANIILNIEIENTDAELIELLSK